MGMFNSYVRVSPSIQDNPSTFLGSMTGQFWPFAEWSIISESIWIYPPSWPQLTTELQWISRKRPLKHRHRWGSPGRSGCCSPECHGVSGHLSIFWRFLSRLLLSKLRWFFNPLPMFQMLPKPLAQNPWSHGPSKWNPQKGGFGKGTFHAKNSQHIFLTQTRLSQFHTISYNFQSLPNLFGFQVSHGVAQTNICIFGLPFGPWINSSSPLQAARE